MKGLVLHPLTHQQIEAYIKAPTQVVLLSGPNGSGKRSLARRVAEVILELPPEGLSDYPYSLRVEVEADKKLIAIEALRAVEQFLKLKVPGTASYNRIVVIEDAHLLSTEAQNALLKTLEEPPVGVLFILTVDYEQALLPTVRSRAQAISVQRPARAQLESHFQSFGEAKFNQAYAVSAGLPGLLHALLNDTDHPLAEATARARQLLSQSTYDRLLVVDELSKQPSLAGDTLFILQQMAHVSLQSASGPAAQKWQQVLAASYQATEALQTSAQPKLTLTKLMLSL